MTCCIQDECSFVSLRDVERAMIVFEWFYDKTKVIECELNKQEGYKVIGTYFIIPMHAYKCMLIATQCCCKKLDNGSSSLLSCKITRQRQL